MNARNVQILAHRGASKAERENTVEAFRRARTMRADGIELDVRRTGDEVLVVHHDARLGDGRLIADTHAADLPEHVPTLAAALDACEGMWVNLEVKNDPSEPGFDPTDRLADETMALLDRRGEPDRWLISSFRMETVDRCRHVAPMVRTAWLTSVVPDDFAEVLVGRGHVALHPWVRLLTADIIERSHAAGLVVNTWTCDDPDRMRELISWGIDGICTNVPDVARDVIDAAN